MADNNLIITYGVIIILSTRQINRKVINNLLAKIGSYYQVIIKLLSIIDNNSHESCVDMVFLPEFYANSAVKCCIIFFVSSSSSSFSICSQAYVMVLWFCLLKTSAISVRESCVCSLQRYIAIWRG